MKFKVFIIAILASTLCSAQSVVTPIKTLKGEKWWGLFVDGAPTQPLSPQMNLSSRGQNRVPIMLSSFGRYICADSPIRVDMDAVGINITCDKPVEVVAAGRNLREAYLVACHKNFPPTSIMPAGDLFSKVIYHTSADLRANDNQQALIDYVDRLIAEGFPKGIVVVSDGWSAQPGEYSFNSVYYPSPKQMVDQIHDRGFKVMLSVTPYAPSWGRNFIEYKVKSSLVTAQDGSVVVAKGDEGHFTLFDMSKRSIVDNMRGSLEQLQRETDVDGYFFDCRSVYGVLKDNDMKAFENGVVSLASTFDMAVVNVSPSSRYTTYTSSLERRGGKPFDNLSSSLASALSSSLMGFSSFSMEAPNEMSTMSDMEMLRTIQLSLFMPVAVVPFAPWRIGDNKLYQEVRRNVNLRSKIGPEVALNQREYAKNGVPLMRIMEYQFPREGFADCTDQYVFAGKYLVAPVVNAGTNHLVRVPKGVWQHAWGTTVRGPRVVPIDNSDGRMVIMELVGR